MHSNTERQLKGIIKELCSWLRQTSWQEDFCQDSKSLSKRRIHKRTYSVYNKVQTIGYFQEHEGQIRLCQKEPVLKKLLWRDEYKMSLKDEPEP